MSLKLRPADLKPSSQGCFGKIHRRGVALVLAGAGVDQDGVVRCADNEGLVGDHHSVRCGVVNHRVQGREVGAADLRRIGGEHRLGRAPGAVAFDDGRDRDVTNPGLLHVASLGQVSEAMIRRNASLGKASSKWPGAGRIGRFLIAELPSGKSQAYGLQ